MQSANWWPMPEPPSQYQAFTSGLHVHTMAAVRPATANPASAQPFWPQLPIQMLAGGMGLGEAQIGPFWGGFPGFGGSVPAMPNVMAPPNPDFGELVASGGVTQQLWDDDEAPLSRSLKRKQQSSSNKEQ